jgi:hypothetical protein
MTTHSRLAELLFLHTLTTNVWRCLSTSALVRPDTYYQSLFSTELLCHVCQERPWTQHARWCSALICAGCAEGEPNPEED